MRFRGSCLPMMLRPSDTAWVVLVAAVTGYEVTALARGWELLSGAVDRYRAARPVAVHVGVAYLALHLLRRWPARADPLGRLASRR